MQDWQGRRGYDLAMTFNIQICVDCADAHSQADWWAETLGWVPEPLDQALIDSLLADGTIGPDLLINHNGERRWRDGAAICRQSEVGSPDRLRILFQPVPEPKTAKDRIHLDIHLNGADRDVMRAELEARGATFLYQEEQGPSSWYTMADPEGNEFCIA
ncbi:VOC family protein [Arthrobacter gandavensis]|uniref:VOC family protein n=2 Tax=Arthrobacter TaxID=1663 RepID=UPI0031B5ABF9